MKGTSELRVATPSSTAYQRRWWALLVLCLSLVVLGMDNTILNVTLPTLARDLGATASELQWMVDAYILVFAGLLLTMGALGDRFGRKLALNAGLLVFVAGSVASALAGSPEILIAARAAMGIGGALIMPSTLSIITNVFPPKERGRAIGVWAGVAGLGIVLGPVIGGWLLERFWWGSVFLVNVPVVALAIVAGWPLVPESRDPNATPLDPIGATLSIAALVTLVYGIIQAPEDGWTDPVILGAFAVAAVLSAAFIWWERHVQHPMLRMELFRNPRFSVASGAITMVFFALFGSVFLLTQHLQFVLGYTPLQAGVRILPVAALIVAAPVSARLVERIGTKLVVVASLLIVAGALWLLSTVQLTDGYGLVAASLALLGTGMGFTMAPRNRVDHGLAPAGQRRGGLGHERHHPPDRRRAGRGRARQHPGRQLRRGHPARAAGRATAARPDRRRLHRGRHHHRHAAGTAGPGPPPSRPVGLHPGHGRRRPGRRGGGRVRCPAGAAVPPGAGTSNDGGAQRAGGRRDRDHGGPRTASPMTSSTGLASLPARAGRSRPAARGVVPSLPAGFIQQGDGWSPGRAAAPVGLASGTAWRHRPGRYAATIQQTPASTLERTGPWSRPQPGSLDGHAVRLRPTTTYDAARLTEILSHPEVAQWWGSFDPDRVQRELIDPDDGTVPFAVEADGQVIGLIQYWEEHEPDYRHAAVDIFLHPDWHGRGLGADAVRTLARYLFAQRGHHRLTIDPAAHNQPAIRSYRRLGFRPVGVMRRYERGPDGSWHDGLLMDLLPEDLTSATGGRLLE